MAREVLLDDLKIRQRDTNFTAAKAINKFRTLVYIAVEPKVEPHAM
jgi:hypothetical protein